MDRLVLVMSDKLWIMGSAGSNHLMRVRNGLPDGNLTDTSLFTTFEQMIGENYLWHEPDKP